MLLPSTLHTHLRCHIQLNSLEASYLLAAGRLEQARIRLNRAFDIAPDFWFAHRTQGLLHLAEHHPDLAIESLRRAEARAIQIQLFDQAKNHNVSPVSLAVMHAALGETALALDALGRAYDVRDAHHPEAAAVQPPVAQPLHGGVVEFGAVHLPHRVV